jgi:minor extracellular serine protease Vpr
MNFIPHVATPGGNIFSTYLLDMGGYATLSGTSMSTPYASGMVALYLSLKGPTSPLTVRNLLVTTADPVDFSKPFNITAGLLAPVPQQGGGSANAVRFIYATTEISPGFIELNVIRLKISTHR